MSENFPTFKKIIATPGKMKKLLRVIFFIFVFIAAAIIIKDQVEYTFGLGYWADDYGYEEDSLAGGECNVSGLELRGDIMTYIYSDTADDVYPKTASEDLTYLIGEADKDDNIKAIIVEVDSYGGYPVAAEEISQAVEQAGKPVIAMIREGGTSAAYWAVSGADRIFAMDKLGCGRNRRYYELY